MSAPYNNLESKLEAAAKVVHDAINPATGYTALCGLDEATKATPYVLLHGEKIVEMPLNTGNFDARLTVRVVDNADDVNLTAHRQGAAKVFDEFMADNIASKLSEAGSDFTVLLVKGRTGSATQIEERMWVSEMGLELYACASDLT